MRGSVRKSLVKVSVTAIAVGMIAFTATSGAGATGSSNQGGGGGKVGARSVVTPAGQSTGNITWNVPGEPLNLDPAQSNDPSENTILSNLCEDLFQINPNFTISPWVATGVTQPNSTTYVYTIRKGIKFWNGDKLTAADVVYSLLRNMNPKISSSWTNYFAEVQSIKQTGPYQVTVHLKTPDSLFNSAMATAAGAVMEKSYTEQHDLTVGTPTTPPMCSGPFKFQSWIPGESITIVKNPNYWNKSLEPKASSFTFDFLTSGSALDSALTSGEIQGTFSPPTTTLGVLETSSSGGTVYSSTLDTTEAELFVLGTSAYGGGGSAGILANYDIREALSLAINREDIATTAYYGTVTPARTLTTPGEWFYDKGAFQKAYEALGPINQNITEAKQLVVDAGSPTTPIVFAYNAGNPTEVEDATIIQQEAAQVGLTITLDGLPVSQWVSQLFDPSMMTGENLLFQNFAVSVPDSLDFFANFGGPVKSFLDYGGYYSSGVKKLVSVALSTSNENRKAELEIAAQATMMKTLPIIPLENDTNLLFMSNSVTGAPTTYSYQYYPWAASVGKS